MELSELLTYNDYGTGAYAGSRRLPQGYVRAAELFAAGERIAVYAAGECREFGVEEDTILTVGPDGRVERHRQSEFERKYRFYPGWPYRFGGAQEPDAPEKSGSPRCVPEGAGLPGGMRGDPVAVGLEAEPGKAVPLFLYAHVCVPADGEGRPGGRRAVIFDLDGTLTDTLEDLKEATNAALAFGGMPLCTLEQVRMYLGNGIRNLMRRAVPDGDANPRFEEVFAFFREYYGRHCLENTAPYKYIVYLLRELRAQQVPMAIVSNKVDSAVKELNRMFFADEIEVALGETEGMARKPEPDMVNHALAELGVPAEQAVYVGDSDVDIRTAANAKLPCISVTWGFRDEAFLREHGAQILIQTPLELLYLI